MGLAETKELFEALTAGLAFLVAVAMLWWRISRSAAKTSLVIQTMGQAVERLTSTTADLSKNFIQLATKLDEREREIIKLEGSIDSQRKDMIHLITALQQSNGSLNALWRTMQSLFPAAVPRRASDDR